MQICWKWVGIVRASFLKVKISPFVCCTNLHDKPSQRNYFFAFHMSSGKIGRLNFLASVVTNLNSSLKKISSDIQT